MKKLLALLMAISLTFQLVTPVFAEEIEETQAATEAVEIETEAPTTEIPTTEPTTTDAMETTAPEETSAPTEPQPTTEATEATEPTASTEETTTASTEPTEETTEPTLDLFAEDENVIDSGECGADGDNLTWVLTQDGTLTISGSGSMRGYSIDDERRTTAPWGAYWEQLTALVLEPGVTSIGEWAFYHCGSLVNVAIPESVTSINVSAFRSCSSLTSVTIPDSVTSIGAFAFESCEKLTSVTISDSVTSICRSAFQACSSLKSVTIPDSVTSIGELAFASCHSLTSVTIPDSVTSIDEGAFCCCDSLRGIFTSDRNSNYTSVDGVLFDKGCTTLINYPAGHNGTAYQIPEGVTSIGRWSFGGCSRLKSVTIPKGVMSIGSAAFLGCSSLTSVTIPEGVTSIGDSAFHSCSSLTSVTILEGVTSIGGLAFFYCRKLSKLWLPKTVTFIDYGAFFRCDSLKNVYYGGSNSEWNAITIEDDNSALKNAERTYGVTETPGTEIQPVGTTALISGSKLTLTAWAMPDGKKIKANWSLASGDEAYASITSSGVLTAKAVGAIQEITVIATPTDGSPEATKTVRILPQAKEIVLSVDGASAPSTLNPDMYERTTLDFCAEVQPEGALTQVTWSSNNPKVAAVAADGTVTLLKPGTAVIKAMAADGSKVAAQVTLNVIYTDHSPRLGASALKLNTAYSLGTTVDFVERHENRVETVSVSDDRFDISYEGNRLTLKAQEPGLKGSYKLTLEAVCADGRTYSYPLTVKAAPTLPRLTVKQTEKFNLFYQDSRAALTISGGEVEEVELIGTNDFILEKEDGAYIIRYADPENAPEKPDTKATLYVTFAGYNMPVTKALTISTTNAAPKIKLNPTSSILNTYLKDDLTVNPTILGTEDESLEALSVTDGVDAFIEEGVLHVRLSNPKSTTATLYFRAIGWTKSVKVTHKITVTDKKPTVKLSAKGKLDVLNPASEIVYTPKLTNATGTIESVRLEGADAELFNAEVVDGLVHLTMKADCEYATKKTYKVTPIVTLLGKDITGPALSIKVTQSTLKLAKIPNQTVSKSSPEDLTVNIKITSPLTAKIGDVQLNAKTTAALRKALEAADGIDFEADTVTFPASAFAALKPGKYNVILDVTPANAASDTKPIQAKFTLTVQK